MQLPYSDVLDIAHFSRLFDNKSESYKLFWFQAIARKIKEGRSVITFEALIDEMIADAWYMVSEYHLNLGPNDTLERVVHRLSEISHMKSSEKKEAIAGAFYGVHEGKRVEQIREKSCSKNQSGKKTDILFFTISRSGHPNSNSERVGGLYRTELRNHTGVD